MPAGAEEEGNDEDEERERKRRKKTGSALAEGIDATRRDLRNDWPCGMVYRRNTMPFLRTWVSPRYSASLSQRRMLIGRLVVRTKLLVFLKHFPSSVKENPCSSRSQAKKSCIITQSPGPDRARIDRSTALFLTLCVVVFLENFILLDYREAQFALFSSRFSFRYQRLDSCSQDHSKRFRTICQVAELTQLILQESTRRNHLALSFLAIFSD